MAKLKKSYDALIFGGGLSGLLAAKVLAKKNKSFLIVEPSERLGGRLTGWSVDNNLLPSNLNLYTYTEDNLAHFNWLEQTLEQNILDGSFQTTSLHFQDGGFKSFNGFGDRSPEALEQLNKFCFEHEKIKVKSFPQNWISQMVSELNEDHYILNSEITKVNFLDAGSEFKLTVPSKENLKPSSKEGKAVSAEINGKTIVEFEHLIWAVAPQKLLDTIAPEMLGASESKKLKRQSGVFDSVILNLAHQDFTFEDKNINSVHCLYGSQQEFEPIIGTVSKDFSCWMTLIDTEKTLDHEFVSKVIKNMKKQIKRAFPELLDFPKLQEKIIISESSYGQLSLKETETGFLKTIPNLFCTSSLCSPLDYGLIGTLDRAQSLESSI